MLRGLTRTFLHRPKLIENGQKALKLILQLKIDHQLKIIVLVIMFAEHFLERNLLKRGFIMVNENDYLH